MARNAKQRLLEEAESLFLKYGWQRVTVDEICRKTGVTRKTFYTYYSNKDEMVFSVLTAILGRMMEVCSDVFNNSETNFAEKLKQLTLFNLEYAKSMGMEFVEDLMLSKDARIMEIQIESGNWANELFANAFEAAKKNGEVREDVNIHVFLAIVQYLKPLYMQPEFQAYFSNVSDMVEQVSNMLYYGIFKNEK